LKHATPKKRPISGLLLLDKPVGYSSNHVLQKVKQLFRAEKAGHTGTLDPFATGLLLICLGEATKFSSYGLEGDKRYLATLKLGMTTTTGDIEGEIVSRRDVNATPVAIERVLQTLRGTISQIAPIYSALKVAGKPMYDYARKGLDVERKTREVEIKRLDCISFSGDELVIDVVCSKGTYIRTLGEDIGASLGCGAHLIALRRTGSSALTIDRAISLEQLESLTEEERDTKLLPNDALLNDIPSIMLEGRMVTCLRRGQVQEVHPDWLPGIVTVYDSNRQFVGLAEITDAHQLLAKRLIAEQASSSVT
jgi:tRNA pseudouridine55 synthase